MRKKHYHKFLVVFAMIFSMLFASQRAYTQKLSKYYSFFSQDVGNLYHITSIEPFSAKKPAKELRYDLTYLDSKDSIAINILYCTQTMLALDSIFFIGTDVTLPASLEKIFISSKKSTWMYRYTLNLKYDECRQFFNSEKVPVIQLKDKNGAMHLCIISQGKWNKSADIIRQIFTLIDVNRKGI